MLFSRFLRQQKVLLLNQLSNSVAAALLLSTEHTFQEILMCIIWEGMHTFDNAGLRRLNRSLYAELLRTLNMLMYIISLLKGDVVCSTS